MMREELRRANELVKEIEEIEDFIDTASKVWTGKLVSGSYGTYGQKEFHMNTDIKNRVLEVLKEYNNELIAELEKI